MYRGRCAVDALRQVLQARLAAQDGSQRDELRRTQDEREHGDQPAETPTVHPSLGAAT